MKCRSFNAHKMFQYAILCVRAMVRIKRLRFTPEPLSMDVAQVDPYRIKMLRKVSCVRMFYMRLIILAF
jgi:phosphorylase kinase gamma subunit